MLLSIDCFLPHDVISVLFRKPIKYFLRNDDAAAESTAVDGFSTADELNLPIIAPGPVKWPATLFAKDPLAVVVVLFGVWFQFRIIIFLLVDGNCNFTPAR